MAKKEKSILTLHQKDFLKEISKDRYFTQRFYFTGGTALAEFYLKHRVSEDLDFFREEKEVNPIPIIGFLKERAKKLNLEIVFGGEEYIFFCILKIKRF